MSAREANQSDPIIIVGAGIFGLSTAIHLARRKYTNVTIFDKQPYHETQYSYFNGCDGASADINKIFRSAYGGQKEYMQLSLEAVKEWQAWNDELANGSCVPEGMTADDRVFINNGNLSLTDEPTLPLFERLTVQNMEELGYPDTQFITTDPAHVSKAKERGFGFAIDPFRRASRGQRYLGVLDSTGGTTIADKACRFALHKAQTLGVRTVFGPQAGHFVDFTRTGDNVDVDGIRTADGRTHKATTVIMACGGWTPSLVPSLDSVCEATAGSVVIFRIPTNSPLMQQYSPQNFPTWTWNVRAGAAGGLYGFGVTDSGLLKIGYRGTKFTNPRRQPDGVERSVPATRYSVTDGADERIEQIPRQAWRVVAGFVASWMPELLDPAAGVSLETTRVCWYTDSWDNHFVVDWVPHPVSCGGGNTSTSTSSKRSNVLVATAGSGHAFKYLPTIGAYIVDIMEGKAVDRDIVRKWRWRRQPLGASPGGIVNNIMQGSTGPRVIRAQKMTRDEDFTLDGMRAAAAAAAVGGGPKL